MAKSPILGGFSTARAPGAADNALVNMQVEVTESKDGKVPGFLFLSSGLDLVLTVGNGPIRGVLPLADKLYVVSGPEVWSVTSNLTKTLLGTIGDQDTPVSMFQNTFQLMIVDGVGAWVVPGGYPLTASQILDPGALYAIGDTVTMQASSGFQTAYPVLTVTAVADRPVGTYLLPNAGTGYATATGVATTNIQPQPGVGTGLTINVTAVSQGRIQTAALGVGGTGYAVNDTGFVLSNSRDAVYRVTSVAAGVVTGFIIVNPGSAYTTTGVATTQAAPGLIPNNGAGFTLNITAVAGVITASTLAFGGHGYAPGNAGFVSGGAANASYLVTTVGANGSITGFQITEPGAIDEPSLTFFQRATSGSGQGLTLISPTFGAFVGLVPVTMPFPNPVVGGVSDGFGVLVFQGQQKIAASEQSDLSTWPALSFGVANQSPDNCISLSVIHDEVYILKENNTEIWVNQGLANFPFAPLTSVHIETGCAAPFSVDKAGEELIWLSRNDQGEGIIVSATGSRPTPISTQALVSEIAKYANIGDAIGYARQEGEHVYYVITFPEADKTWIYDQTASALVGYPIWSQLAALDNGEMKRHWGNCFVPWRGSGSLTTTSDTYDPQAVLLTSPTELRTATGLVGLPTTFRAAVFSVWLDLSDPDASGIIFSNQDVTPVGGMEITIQNDTIGSPEITIKAWDSADAAIVVATYDFATWDTWVNLLISIDTVSHDLQVYANTQVSGALVEDLLTATAITWFSSNPIGAAADKTWHLEAVT